MTLQVLPTDRLTKMVQTLKDWDLTLPKKRVMSERNIEQEIADLLEREYKRFIAMAVLSPDHLGMGGLVDELWHAHVLFTKDYHSFCHEVAGLFIHHVPNTDDEEDTSKLFRECTVPLYQNFFGHSMPDIWFGKNGDCTQDTCGDACQSQCGQCRSMPPTLMKDDFPTGANVCDKKHANENPITLQHAFDRLDDQQKRILLSQL